MRSDIECGFIEAEVMSFADPDARASVAHAKAVQRVRLKGKGCVMANGYVVQLRINCATALAEVLNQTDPRRSMKRGWQDDAVLRARLFALIGLRRTAV